MRPVAIVAAVAVCVHAGLWGALRKEASAPDFPHQISSVSYAPYIGSAHPDRNNIPTAEQIRSDLELLAPLTQSIRTYSSTGGVELVAPAAAKAGFRVSLGAWIDKNKDRNEREIKAAIELSRRHSNVKSIVVGNETIYRDELKVDELIEIINKVKRQTGVPVTTGEIWNVWIEHPELVSAVDYIAAHILPYWEGFSEKQAVDQAIRIYDKLRQTYPGKRIVIAEFGWPSAGYNRRDANPGRSEQAQVIRDFVSRARAYGIDYNIVEAFDQPWKTFEGGVGPHWGLYDAARQPKFDWTGPVVDRNHWRLAGLALLIGLLLSLPIFVMSRATAWEAALLAASANVAGAWFANVFAYWEGHYFTGGAAFALGLGIALLIPLVAIALARMEEIAAVVLGHAPQRLANPSSLPMMPAPPLAPEAAAAMPMVSIHIPAYREPPDMLKATLDSVARLEYPNFECVVVINNTPDPALWQPVEEHCRLLGPRFKFVREDEVVGFKAGALRLALEHTAAEAEIIGVLDADYMVRPDWLIDLVPLFADPRVGLVQAPQDHRDDNRSVMHRIMNAEYAGFFDIGMVQRNEVNAIIVHGTMCLIRRAAMEDAGGWSSDTICEDTDLGLSILERGWTAHYTNRRYGYGLLPDTFEAYKKQRNRWAYGGIQIVMKHWRCFRPGASALTRNQKREFALGWLVWLGAETLGVTVAILNLLWTPVVVFAGIAIPDKILTLPILAVFGVSLLHFAALYRKRVAIPPGRAFGAVFAALSVQWTVALAVTTALVRDRLPFARTAKGGAGTRPHQFEAFWEALLGALLLVAAVLVLMTNYERVRELNVFAAVLVLQSLPFLAAVAIALLERSRLNAFATWRALEARISGLLPHRPAAVIAHRPQSAANERIDSAG
jgi:exo-beta-1,3-glucanase (GH17 family)/cellulose synthase/poly-beta-1,6-N-acetylglucosamine synthase-like glycosyltransferase